METYDQDIHSHIHDHLHKIEDQLISLWCAVLKTHAIDRSDRFLHLGGNSLKAVQIIAAIEKIFSVRLPVALIFKYDTVETLAVYLNEGNFSTVKPGTEAPVLFTNKTCQLTDLQKNFYFLYQYQREYAFVYNVPLILEIKGSLDYSALSRSVNYLLERHDVLRAIFYNSVGGMVQEVCEHSQVITLVPELIDEGTLADVVRKQVNQYIPLDVQPLVKVKLLKLAHNRYVLVIVQPHIMTDGKSLEILKEELFLCYSAFINNQEPQLPLIKNTYLNYINKAQASNKDHATDIAYWQKKLENVQDISFPYDYVRPKEVNFSGKKYCFSVGEVLFRKLKDFSALHNVTPFMSIATILNILLAQHCAQEDIVIGFPISGRSEFGLEQTLGSFVNTLVLRNKIALEKTFIELLDQVRGSCLDAYAHQNVPFNELVTHLNVNRRVNVHPIFQVMLVWQDWYEGVTQFTDAVQVSSMFVDQQTSKFDLSFELVPTALNLTCFIEYNTSLFRPETMTMLADQFVNLIDRCLDCYGMPVEKMPLQYQRSISAEIPQKLVPESLSVRLPHEVFEAHARKAPEKVALIYQGQSLTYAALNAQASQLAHYIQSTYPCFNETSTAERPIVAILLDKGVDVIVSMLAVLKLGAAYAPIDVRSPEQRISFIVSDLQCHLVLTESSHKAVLQSPEQAVLFLDEVADEVSQCSADNFPSISKPEDLMYIIYTSGTTGQPKGVMQTHFNLARLFKSVEQVFDFNDSDTWIFFHSHAFDFSVWEIWGAFLHGAQLVIPMSAEITDPACLYQLVTDHSITVLNQTPSAFQGFSQECVARNIKELPLRYVIFGGESLDINMLSDWWQQYSETHPCLVNMYGITETTVHTTYKVLSCMDLHRRENSNIGVPLPDMSAVIVDKNMQAVSMGIPGELLVGGNGLALGYFNRPDMTQEKFIDYPLNATHMRNRFYRTGDLVRYLSDGSLEYLGRIDKQIKFKGFRIETEELESALRGFPEITQCAIAIKSADGVKKLVAYYALKKDVAKKPLPQELHHFLRSILPSYMMPNLFIHLDKIPVTNNMKVDYEKLPPIKRQAMDLGAKRQGPKTAPQKALVSIWEQTLHVKNVGLNDNFFGIGGDSITSLRVVAEARKKGFSLSVSDVFKYQTIREITEYCWNEQKLAPSSGCPSEFAMLTEGDKRLLPSDSVDAYPLSLLQLGMIYHTAYSPNSAVYLDVFSYKVKANYNHDYFVLALCELIQAHPILRTTFHLESYSEPMQIVHELLSPVVERDNLSALSEASQDAALMKWMDAQKMMPFDFKTGPLFRITTHRLSDTRFHVGFSFHHAILDGWSVATFITTLLLTYAKLLEGKRPALKVNEHYRQFIYSEKCAINADVQKVFWKNYLNDFEVTQIDRWHDTQRDDNVFNTHALLFNKETTQSLVALAKALNVSVDVILLTALVKLISVLTSREEILIGVVFNGRPPLEGIEGTLGLFLNALPFRQEISSSSWRRLISAVSNNKAGIYPYRRYPLMQIQEDMSSGQLFNILFYFTNFHVYGDVKESKHVEIVNQKFYERTNFPLTFNCALKNELKVFVNYETKSYTHEQVSAFSAYFHTILMTMVADLDAEHNLCEILSPSESQLILSDWNNTAIPYSLDKSVPQLIEEQAQRTPHYTALHSTEAKLSYHELNSRANFFAQYLKNEGVSSGDFVVVYMNRSVHSVVAVLAILKLGAVYVPIDTMQPLERVAYILGEVACQCILANEVNAETAQFHEKFSDVIIVADKVLEEASTESLVRANVFSPEKLDLAYVIYTSGSTGNPKGVMIQHGSLVNFLFDMKEKTKMHEEACLLALTSFSFDISLLEIFLPLITGATAFIASSEQSKDPTWIANIIQEASISFIQATPTTWKMLADFGYHPGASVSAISGGEPLTKSVADFLAKSHSAWNMYGPTEATVWSTVSPILPGQNTLSPAPIGKPIANTKVYVLNKNLQPVPIGVPGELYISGVGLAKGYLHKAQLTQERFIDNPFSMSDETYTKMYKTGDLVKWLPNGTLYFMGRMDYQFKLRGFRIEAGDIESALLQHAAIKEAVVLVKKVNDMDCLVAYVALNNKSESPETKAIRAFLLKKLPYYMLPEVFVFIDAVPTNINGKVDIKALTSRAIDAVAPQKKEAQHLLTEAQQSVADIWGKVLPVQLVSPSDTFYDLGGNSILSLMVVQYINECFSVNLSIRDFIEYSTLSELTDFIVGLKGADNKGEIKMDSFSFVKKIPDPIVKLKKEGAQNPLFLVHPVGGTVFYYIPLVKGLTSDRPVYAIQDPGIETKDRLFASLSEMAEFYVGVIKKYQPTGPYYIAGSSFGANAVVEMARQLTEEGETVAFAGLIDGWAKYPDRANEDKEWFANNLKMQMSAMNTLLPEVHLSDLLLDIHWHRQQLLVQHEIQSDLPLNLTLFKAEETMEVLRPLESPYNNWEQYCIAPPATYVVPGDHFTMHFEPHIGALANAFDSCLAEADDKGGA